MTTYKRNKSDKISIASIQHTRRHVDRTMIKKGTSSSVLLDKCIADIEAPHTVLDLIMYARSIQYYYEHRPEAHMGDNVLCSIDLNEYSVNIQIFNIMGKARLVTERKLIFPIAAETVYTKSLIDIIRELYPDKQFGTLREDLELKRIVSRCIKRGLTPGSINPKDIPTIVNVCTEYFNNESSRAKYTRVIDGLFEVGYHGTKDSACNIVLRYRVCNNDIGTKRYDIFIAGVKKWVELGQHNGGPSPISLKSILGELHFY